VLTILTANCARASTGERIGGRFATNTPPPACLATPRADTMVVPVALVDPKPMVRAGRMVVHDVGLLAKDEVAVVLLEFVVNVDGSVDSTSVKTLEASNPAFVSTAHLSLSMLEFWPGCVRAEAVRTRVAQRFRFGSGPGWAPVLPPPPILPSNRP